jgi:hypothetical protein
MVIASERGLTPDNNSHDEQNMDESANHETAHQPQRPESITKIVQIIVTSFSYMTSSETSDLNNLCRLKCIREETAILRSGWGLQRAKV